MKSIYLITLGFVTFAVLMAACSAAPGVAKINVDSNGLAVKGYDAVEFFTGNAAVQGNLTFEYAWNGAKWVFSTAENLVRFKANPEAYAPQFGGYCSYAVSQGYTADGDPNQWKIVDGKLYLNYNQRVKDAWEKEQEKYIEDGKANWAEFQKKKPEHKG